MKIRNGFVSNSSSSSFLIYGVCLTEDALRGKLRTQLVDFPDLADYSYLSRVWDTLRTLTQLEGIEYNVDGNDNIYIGMCPTRIRDDETGLQFKNSIEEALKRILGDDINCNYHEGVEYN